MNARSIVAVSAVGLAAAGACVTPEGSPDGEGTWVGTITTEGNVTTVINESGSVWGGTARLLEEASIGVESGAEEYMLGQVRAVYGTDDHIFVVDGQAKLVRRYDADGVFIDNIGRIGQGPGEYTEPVMITVGRDGGIFIYDWGGHRNLVFAADGTPLDTWPAQGAFCCVNPIFLDAEGKLWMPTYRYDRQTVEEVFGIQVFGPDGAVAPEYRRKDLEVDRPELSAGGRRVGMPFAPGFVATIAGPERYLVGTNDTYRFEHQLRGETVLVVEKHWDPVPIDPEHAEWQRRATTVSGRRYDPGWTWDGADMPRHHPAYGDFFGSASGETWVARHGPSVRVADCVEDPLADDGSWESTPSSERYCWRNTYILDVFDAEGRYLGAVEMPADVFPYSLPLTMHVAGDRVVAWTQDELGVIRVKRYRLVLPNKEEH